MVTFKWLLLLDIYCLHVFYTFYYRLLAPVRPFSLQSLHVINLCCVTGDHCSSVLNSGIDKYIPCNASCLIQGNNVTSITWTIRIPRGDTITLNSTGCYAPKESVQSLCPSFQLLENGALKIFGSHINSIQFASTVTICDVTTHNGTCTGSNYTLSVLGMLLYNNNILSISINRFIISICVRY